MQEGANWKGKVMRVEEQPRTKKTRSGDNEEEKSYRLGRAKERERERERERRGRMTEGDKQAERMQGAREVWK